MKHGYLIFLLPTLIVIVVFYLVPALLTLLIGLTNMDYSFDWNWIGPVNYLGIFEDPRIPKIFTNTLFYVFTTLLFFNVGMALVISLLTTHMEERVGSAFRAIWLLPRITPSTIYALLWMWAARPEPNSLFNSILGYVGLKPVSWLHSYPWLIIILVNGFVGTSFGMIIFTAGLKSIPEDYLRAGKIDGASTVQSVRYIELPLIKWPLLFGLAYQTLSLLTSYEYILLVTDGGPGYFTTEVWALYSYHQAFKQYGGIVYFGYGAALISIIAGLGLMLSIVYWKVFRMRKMITEPKIEVGY